MGHGVRTPCSDGPNLPLPTLGNLVQMLRFMRGKWVPQLLLLLLHAVPSVVFNSCHLYRFDIAASHARSTDSPLSPERRVALFWF